MMIEKKALKFEDLEAQTALELPDRQMMLVTIVITNVLNNLDVDIDVKNVNVAVQICNVVQLLNGIIVGGNILVCDIHQ